MRLGIKSSKHGKKAHIDIAAAKRGDADALFNLGVCYDIGHGGIAVDKLSALTSYKLSAEAGCKEAMNNLGCLLFFGDDGIPVNKREGVRWFASGARLGDDCAAYHYGCCLKMGEGVDVDKDAALMWLKKSAELGNTAAQDVLVRTQYQNFRCTGDFSSWLISLVIAAIIVMAFIGFVLSDSEDEDTYPF